MDKYRDGIFKIPYLNSWHIVVSGPKLIDELRQAKDDELSFAEAVAEVSLSLCSYYNYSLTHICIL